MLPEVALDPLTSDLDGVAVAAIGGGHGLAQVLEAVVNYAQAVSAVVTVADDGGSSGRLTAELGIPPPGDLRKCLLALSPEPSVWRELFAYRFQDSDVAGHSLGNLMLAALTDIFDEDFSTALRVAGNLLGARGDVIPAACRSLRLRALVDGAWIDGQVKIATTRGTIEKLCLEPKDEPANPAALDAIHAADQIILGPGSLYTSVLSALIVPGIGEAVNAAKGRLVYIMNLTTQSGETEALDGIGHLDALIDLGGLDRHGTVVAHRGPLDVPDGLSPLHVDEIDVAAYGWSLVTGDLADRDSSWPQHDPIRLGAMLSQLE